MGEKLSALRLKELLTENNMKAVELCTRTGIYKGTISQYIHGTHTPTNLKAKQIAEVFNVNPLWVMGFDVPKYETDTIENDAENAQLLALLRKDEQATRILQYYTRLTQAQKNATEAIIKSYFPEDK